MPPKPRLSEPQLGENANAAHPIDSQSIIDSSGGGKGSCDVAHCACCTSFRLASESQFNGLRIFLHIVHGAHGRAMVRMLHIFSRVTSLSIQSVTDYVAHSACCASHGLFPCGRSSFDGRLYHPTSSAPLIGERRDDNVRARRKPANVRIALMLAMRGKQACTRLSLVGSATHFALARYSRRASSCKYLFFPPRLSLNLLRHVQANVATRPSHKAVPVFTKVKPFAGVQVPLHGTHLVHAGGS